MDWKDIIEEIQDALPYSIKDIEYEPLPTVCYAKFDIEGDWKHDHARFKYHILEQICEEHNIAYDITDIFNINNDDENIVVGYDESDYFRATYEVVMEKRA